MYQALLSRLKGLGIYEAYMIIFLCFVTSHRPEAVTAHHNGDSSMMVVSAPLPSATQLHPDLVKDTHQKRLDTDDKRNDRTVKMGALRT